jgi:hypothetical protein
MLTHRFDPVQTQRMQHGTRTLHDTQHRDCACEPEVENGHHEEGTLYAREAECVLHGHVPEHNGETLMGERQSPKAQVGCSVGDTVETKF